VAVLLAEEGEESVPRRREVELRADGLLLDAEVEAVALGELWEEGQRGGAVAQAPEIEALMTFGQEGIDDGGEGGFLFAGREEEVHVVADVGIAEEGDAFIVDEERGQADEGAGIADGEEAGAVTVVEDVEPPRQRAGRLVARRREEGEPVPRRR
jgi:hypothetical protein